MASIIAYTEIRHEAITGPSRFALAEARRIADDLGATVYALLALGPTAADQLSALAGEVGTAGADRILCCTDEALQGPSRDATHGPLLASAAERLRPTLVLFPEGGSGPEMGPPLAGRMGATFLPGSSLQILAGTDLQPAQLVIHSRPAGDGQERVVALREIECPAVLALCAGSASLAMGEPAAEMEMLSYPMPTPTPPHG